MYDLIGDIHGYASELCVRCKNGNYDISTVVPRFRRS